MCVCWHVHWSDGLSRQLYSACDGSERWHTFTPGRHPRCSHTHTHTHQPAHTSHHYAQTHRRPDKHSELLKHTQTHTRVIMTNLSESHSETVWSLCWTQTQVKIKLFAFFSGTLRRHKRESCPRAGPCEEAAPWSQLHHTCPGWNPWPSGAASTWASRTACFRILTVFESARKLNKPSEGDVCGPHVNTGWAIR